MILETFGRTIKAILPMTERPMAIRNYDEHYGH